jgi:3-methylcrotonyl-CoA carboxylase alpha subunit
MCDEAYLIGAPPARESYLRADRILEVARRSGAEAIHPGYGFLSENADFADACAKAGLVFVGPPASAIRAMGSKSAAKELMAKAGVPLVPAITAMRRTSYSSGEADKIGYPVSDQGDRRWRGKGKRIVSSPRNSRMRWLARKRRRRHPASATIGAAGEIPRSPAPYRDADLRR